MCPVARSQTDTHRDGVTTLGTLSGFQGCFLIKDRPKNEDTIGKSWKKWENMRKKWVKCEKELKIMWISVEEELSKIKVKNKHNAELQRKPPPANYSKVLNTRCMINYGIIIFTYDSKGDRIAVNSQERSLLIIIIILQASTQSFLIETKISHYSETLIWRLRFGCCKAKCLF